MSTMARVLLPLAEHPPVRCDALHAPVMPARVCVHHATRTTQRPLACATCPVGAAVRAATGTPDPTPRAVPASLVPKPRTITGACKRAGEGCPGRATTTAGYCGSCERIVREAKGAQHAPVWGARTKLEGDALDDATRAYMRLRGHYGSTRATARALGYSDGAMRGVARGLVSRKTAAKLAAAVRALPTKGCA